MKLFCHERGGLFLLLCMTHSVVFVEGNAPTATITTSSMAGVQRSYVHFICRVTGDPKPSITWYQDSVYLNGIRTQKFPHPEGGLLRVGSLIPRRHEGEYQCKASNSDGSAMSQAVPLKVYTARRNLRDFPRIAKNPGSFVKSSGEEALFQCVATGNPSPVISWMKDYVPVDLSNPKVSVPQPGSLKIVNVDPRDAGRYECVANNSKGMVYSRYARLRIQDALWGPRITTPPQPFTADPETDVILNCSATGNPQPSIVWEHDGTRLPARVDGSLVISSIQRSGNYTCVADSVKGQVRASAYVTVRDLPFAPTKPIAMEITSTSISVSWQPGGGPPVKSYTLNYRVRGVPLWTVISGIRGRMSWSIDNLQPYVSYQFRVFALNDVGTSKSSPMAEFTTSPKAPGTPPQNIQSRGLSDTSFEATWLPPSQPNGPIRGYRLYYSTDLAQEMIQWRFSASATNHTIVDGLRKKTTYFFKILAYNSVGTGPLSELFAVKTASGVPGQPQNVQVTVLSSTSIQVTWKPPQYSGGGIFGYEIYYNKTSVELDTNIDVVDSLGKDIMGLHPFTYYKVQVAAKSDKGIGPMSFAVVVQTLEDAPSDAPRNIHGKGVDSTSLEISWDPPRLEHRNGIITHYTIKYKEKGSRARYVTVDGIKTSMSLHNLKKYTTYFVWLSASTRVDEGPQSEKQTFSTAEDVPSGAPRELRCKVINSSTIIARWSAPLQAQQDGKIQGYMVFYLKVDDQGNQLVHGDSIGEMKDSESPDNMEVVLTNLEPETNYKIEVAAYTRKGDGARSAPVFAKTLPKLPDAPFVFARSTGASSDVTIGWRTSVSGVLSYKLRYGKSLQRLRARDQASLKMKEMTFVPPTNQHQFQELSPGVWYLFRVSLRTKAGWSPEEPYWVETQPGPPTGPPLEVRAYPVSSTSIRVTWAEPDEWERNGPLTGYSLVYNPLNRRAFAMVKNVTNPNQTRVVIAGLKMFTEYEIRIRAIGLKGPGPLSRSVVERTQEDVPSPPRDISATARSTTIVTVSWKSPQFPNGVVLGYIVLYSDDPSLPLKKWSIKNANGYSSKLKALSRHTTYWIRVAAETSVGRGNYSLPVSSKTLKYDLPESCRDLKLGKANSESVELTWQSPEMDAGITKYQVSYLGTKSYTDKGETKQLTHKDKKTIDALSPGEQAYTLKGLVPHTHYEIKLSAVNSIGEGPSINLHVKTDKGSPPPLQRPAVSQELLTEDYVPLNMEIASERNGPISYYIVIVVPLGKSNQLPKDKNPDDYFTIVRRRRDAEDGSEKPYIAAKFLPSELPEIFNVGDKNFKNLYGYHNKKLTKGLYYTMFTRAYVKSDKGEELYTSSPFVTPVKSGAVGDTAGGGVSPGAQQDPEEHKGGGLNLTFVIIPVVAVVVITAIVVIVVLVYRRRRRGKSKSSDEEKSEPSDPVELKRMTFQTPGMMDHPPIPVAELFKHIENLKADSGSNFTHEYESIEPGQTFTSDASTQEYNRPKNRYPNILAFDHSRVRLAPMEGITGSDYINANFCDGYRKENAYIATQGPLEDTICDFWRMVWEQRTFTIVMLTNLEERGRIKCEQYWPLEHSKLYGDIEVTVVEWVELANYTITTLQICKEGSPQAREVKHFQFTGWPDHGVPPHPTPFLAFLRRVRFYNPPDAGPIVAHCSAGVGRTACFIVIDSMLERVKHENTVDIYGHVTVLRTQRNFMVQTEEQYMFIHEALLEAVSCGNTEVHARSLLQHIKRLTELGNGEVTGLEEEFRRLSNPNHAHRRRQGAGSLPMNRSKNRLANILPFESTRVQLTSVRGIEGSDYINASFIDGYRQRWAYIATQGPLQDTVDDFWRMLMEQSSNIVVMLTQLHEGDRERCFKYWPDDRSARHQYYIVDPVSEQEFAQFLVRDFKVKDARTDTVRNIKQFHFFRWPDSGVPKSGEGIVDLIGQVQKAYEQQEEEGPITVHCSDGVGRSGVFCTLCIVLERMRSEGVVDLFQTVKLLRTQRPNMIQTQEQYLFCYKTALEYLSSFDHYAV